MALKFTGTVQPPKLSPINEQKTTPDSQPSPIQRLLKNPEPEPHDKWYKGEQPTASEIGARIYTISQTDPNKGRELFNQFQQFQADPSSPYFNPYTQSTNKAIQELSNLGFDMSGGITQEWLAQNSWLKNYYRMENGNTPLAPSSKSTKEQDAAYWYYKALSAEETTQKAENEWAALQEEIKYWTGRTDRNYSDDDILAKINWKNYPTLAGMDEARGKGLPTVLNRGIGYSQDSLRGVIWAARNGDESGDYWMDSVKAELGQGNRWKDNSETRAKLEIGNEAYSPYSVGSTDALDDAALYFGVSSFGLNWLADNIGILNGNDATAKKYYDQVAKAEMNTVKAEAELKNLHADIDEWMKYTSDPDMILDGLLDGYTTLKQMDESMKTGKLLATTRAVNFRMQDIENEVRKRCEQKNAAPTGNQYVQQMGDALGAPMASSESDDAVLDAKNDSIKAAAPTIKDAGTDEEKLVFQTAYEYDFDGYAAKLSAAIENGTLEPQAARAYVLESADQYAKANYFSAQKAMRPYLKTQAQIETLETEQKKLKRQRELEMRLMDWEDNAPYKSAWSPYTSLQVGNSYYYVGADFDSETGTFRIGTPERIQDTEYDAEQSRSRLEAAQNLRSKVTNWGGDARREEVFVGEIYPSIEQYASSLGLGENEAKTVANQLYQDLNDYYAGDTDDKRLGTIIWNVLDRLDEAAEEKTPEMDAAAQVAADEWAATLPDFSAYAEPGKRVERMGGEEFDQLTEDLREINSQISGLNDQLKGQQADYDKGQEQIARIEKSYKLADDIAELNGIAQRSESNVMPVMKFLYAAGGEWQPTDYQNVYSLYDAAMMNGYDYDVVAQAAAEGKAEYEEGLKNLQFAMEQAEEMGVPIDADMQENLDRRAAWYQQQIDQADWFLAPEREDYNTIVEETREAIMAEYDQIERADGLLARNVSESGFTILDQDAASTLGHYRDDTDMPEFSDEERNTYLYIRSTKGPDEALRYYQYLQERMNSDFRQSVIAAANKAVKSGAVGSVGANILATITAPFELLPSLGIIESAVFGTELSPNNPIFTVTNFRNAVRNTSKEEINKATKDKPVENFLANLGYDLATNMADNAVNIMTFDVMGSGISNVVLRSAIGAMPMAVETGSTSYQNAMFAGASKEQALAMAGASMFSEWVTETIEVNTILNAFGKGGMDAAAASLKQLVGGALQSMGNEGVGEGLSELIEYFLDHQIKENMNGLEPEEWDWAQIGGDIAYASLLGALSGGLFQLSGDVYTGRTRQAIELQFLAQQQGVSATKMANEINEKMKAAREAAQAQESAEEQADQEEAEDAQQTEEAQETAAENAEASDAEQLAALQERRARRNEAASLAEGFERGQGTQALTLGSLDQALTSGQIVAPSMEAANEWRQQLAEAEELERQAEALRQQQEGAEMNAGPRQETGDTGTGTETNARNQRVDMGPLMEAEGTNGEKIKIQRVELDEDTWLPMATLENGETVAVSDMDQLSDRDSILLNAAADMDQEAGRILVENAAGVEAVGDYTRGMKQAYSAGFAGKALENVNSAQIRALDQDMAQQMWDAGRRAAQAESQQHEENKQAQADAAAQQEQDAAAALAREADAQAARDAEIQQMLDNAKEKMAAAEALERRAKELRHEAAKRASQEAANQNEQEQAARLESEAQEQAERDAQIQQMLDEAARQKAQAIADERKAKELQRQERKKAKKRMLEEAKSNQQKNEKTLRQEAERQAARDAEIQQMLDDASRRRAEAEDQERRAQEAKRQHEADKQTRADEEAQRQQERDAALEEAAQRQEETDQRVQRMLDEAARLKAEAEEQQRKAEVAQHEANKRAETDAEAERRQAMDAMLQAEAQNQLQEDARVEEILSRAAAIRAQVAEQIRLARQENKAAQLQAADQEGTTGKPAEDRLANLPDEKMVLVNNQVAALTASIEASDSSQTATIAAVLSSEQTAAKIRRMASAAAQHASAEFGGREAAEALSGLLIDAARNGIDNDRVRVAYMTAALSDGQASAVLHDVVASGAKNHAQALVEAAEKDQQDEQTMNDINEAAQENMVANRVRDLAGDKALEVAESPEAKALKKAKEDFRSAQESLQASQKELEALTAQADMLSSQQQETAGDSDYVGRIGRVLNEIKAKFQNVVDLKAAVEAAEKAVKAAQDALGKAQTDALTAARQQAQQDVAQRLEAEQQAEDLAVDPQQGTTYLADNTPLNFHYELADVDTLITSNNDDFERNPNFPEELQPRDRSREANREQVEGIARNLNPARLAESAEAQTGAPIVGSDYVVESGNGRTMAVRRAMNNGYESAANYTNWLRENAARFGLNPADVTDRSVLVRVREGETNRASFAQASNESTTATYSASENAISDAQKITAAMMEQFAPSDDGRLDVASNHGFALSFINNVIPASERNQYLQGNGQISQQGWNRIRNAVLQKAYGSNRIVQLVSESTGAEGKNVLNALVQAAPRVMAMMQEAQNGTVFDIGLADAIAKGAERYVELKNAGEDVTNYLQHGTGLADVFSDSEATRQVLWMLEENKRSAKRIANALQSIMDQLYDAGDPRMGSLLGELQAPDVASVIREGSDKAAGRGPNRQMSFYRGNNGVQGAGANQQTTPKRSPQRIAKDLANALHFGDFIGTRKMNNLPAAVLGYYQHQARYASVRNTSAGNYVVTMHELGHGLSDLLNMTGTQDMINNLDPVFAASYTAQELPGEAFAEFVWRYMADDATARAFAGDAFTDSFERALQERGIARQVHDAATQLRAWVNATTNEQIGTTIHARSERTSLGLGEMIRRAIDRLVDSSNAAEAVNHRIRQETGNRNIPSDLDVRANALMKNTASRRAYAILTQNLTDANWTRTGDGLAVVLERAGLTAKNVGLFERWMLAQHSLDRDARGLPVFDDHITPAARTAFIQDTLAQHPEFSAIERAFQQWRKDFMKAFMVDTGYLSQAAFDRMNAMYPHYVPTQRVKDERVRGRGSKIGDKTYTVRRATGSTEDIWSPLDTFYGMVDSIVNMVSANNAALAWDRAFHQVDGLGEFGREITPDMRQVTVNTESLQRQVADRLENNAADDVIQDVLDMIGTEQSQWINQHGSSLDNVLTVQHADGTRAYYEIADTELYKLLAGINESAGKTGFEFIARLVRVMSALTTGSNPVFAIRNFMRDFQTSVNYGTWAGNYMTGAAKWLRASWDVWRNNGQYQDYTALGGGGWTSIDVRTKKSSEALRQAMYRGYNTQNLGHTLKWAGQKIWETITLARLNEVVEQTSRYAEYKYGQHDLTTAQGRAEGYLAAQEATVDFTRGGNSKVGKILRQLIPFFGASTQGVYRTGRMLTEAERGRAPERFAKTIINTALMSALCVGILKKFMDDDDQEEFAMMSDDLKSKHFYLPNFAPEVFGQQPLIRIPIGQDPLMYAVHSAVTNALWGGTDDGLVIDLGATANTILDNLNPVGNGTIFQPINGVKMNQNWYGSRIVPTRMDKWEATTQYTEETPDVFIEAGRWLGMSPMKVQYLAEQYTGFLGQMLIPAFSKDEHTGEIGGLRAAITAAQKRLTSDPLVSNDVMNSFYDGAAVLEQVKSAAENDRPMNMLRRGLTEEEAGQAYEMAKGMLSSKGIIGETKKAINAAFADIDTINANETLTQEQKYELTSQRRKEMLGVIMEAQEQIGAFIEAYVTGRNMVTDLIEGTYASVPTAYDKLDQTFKGDEQQLYMQRAKAVYDATGEDNALPHPNTSFTSNKQTYEISQADWANYTTQYKIAYQKYLAENGGKWDALSSEEQLDMLRSAHTAGHNAAVKWYKKIHGIK